VVAEGWKRGGCVEMKSGLAWSVAADSVTLGGPGEPQLNLNARDAG
jgi:hypothetical protein